MNKQLKASFMISLMLITIVSAVFNVNAVSVNTTKNSKKECIECQSVNSNILFRVKFLFIKLEIIINIILLKVGNLPTIKVNYQEKYNIINFDKTNEAFCNILMKIGIKIEELYKKFPEGTIIYPILVLMMLQIILLWNKYCDESFINYDPSLIGLLQKNHMIF